jgi:hypothetical protein
MLLLLVAGGWSQTSQATSLAYSGQLELIVTNEPGGRYSGSSLGQLFTLNITYGLESEATTNLLFPGDYDFAIPPFGGSITNGTTITTGSPSPAGIVQVSVVDGLILDADNAALVNSIFGTVLTPGTAVDVSDIDTQFEIEGGGQIVFGLAFPSFDNMAYTGVDFANFGPESGNTDGAFFFIAEENANGDVLFEGYGRATVVPLPAGVWLLGTGVIALAARARSRRRAG